MIAIPKKSSIQVASVAAQELPEAVIMCIRQVYGHEAIPTAAQGSWPSREFRLQQSTVVYGTPAFPEEKGVV